jgi:alkylation response protein AidB-like acyl-CoA dehydrogenase
MNFEDSPEQAAFRAEAQAFLSEHWSLRSDEHGYVSTAGWDQPENLAASRAWQAQRFEAGWATLTWPVEYGGRGLGTIESIIFEQEQERFDTPYTSSFMMGLGMLGPTIMVHGTPAQKERYLPPMARGDALWVQLFSEPSAGSDLAAVRTTATRDGDEWLIEGQKVWTSAAHVGEFGLCVARTDPNVVKHDGLTVFIIDLRAPGVEIRPIRQVSGGEDFNEVYLNGVRLTDDYRLGNVGAGWKVVTTCLMNERVSLDGLWSPGVDELIDLARRVEIDGRPAIEDPSVAERIAEFHVRLAGVERFGVRTITKVAKGSTPGPEASLTKLTLGRLGQEIAAFAVELQGMAGGAFDSESGFQQGYLKSPALRLAGGTDEILRNVLAERVLRLPREARADAGIAFKDLRSGSQES